MLFVYYDTPYYAYQDKVISFALCAYIGLFYAASKHRDVAVIAIVVMGITVGGLAFINTSDALLSLLDDDQSALPYWLQTGFIASFFLVLLGLYIYDGKRL